MAFVSELSIQLHTVRSSVALNIKKKENADLLCNIWNSWEVGALLSLITSSKLSH